MTPYEDFRRFWQAILILLVLLAISLTALECQEVSTEQILEWQKGLVTVNFNNQKTTTGFFVSKDGIIVTPYHVIKGQMIFARNFPIYVTTYKRDESYPAEILDYNKKNDLFILKISHKPEVWFDEFENPKPGMWCTVLGFPWGWDAIQEGLIVIHPYFFLLGVNIATNRGASGSVVLSKEGKVYGMLVGWYFFAVIKPSISIKTSLQRIQEDKKREKENGNTKGNP